MMSKPVIESWCDLSQTGRKINPVVNRIATGIIRSFFKVVVNHLMESNWVSLPYGVTFYIGKHPRVINKQVKERKRSTALLKTGGDWYGIRMDGFQHNCYIRMPLRRRKELFERLKDGQDFIK